MADPVQTPLQGGLTFQQVIDQNPVGYSALDDTGKNQLADLFFNKHVTSQPGFGQLDGFGQQQVRTEFNKRYGLGQIDQQKQAPSDITFEWPGGGQTKAPNWVNGISKAADNVGSTLDVLGMGLPENSIDAATLGAEKPHRYAEQYATDPTWKGDLYRASQNPIWKDVSALPGALFTGSQFIGAAPEYAFSRTGMPVLGKLSNIAQKGILGVGANTAATQDWKNDPIGSAGNTVLSAATGGLMGKNRLANSALQGAGGYISSMGGNALSALTGHQVDWGKVNQDAIRQAIIQAGLGALFHEAEQKKGAQKFANGRPIPKQFVPAEGETAPKKFVQGGVEAHQARQASALWNQSLSEAQQRQSVTERQTLEARMRALKTLHDKVANIPQDAHPEFKVRAEKARLAIKAEYDKVAAEHDKKFGQSSKAAKKKELQGLPDEHTLRKIVDSGVKARSQGNRSAEVFNQHLAENYTQKARKIIQGTIKDVEAGIKKHEAAAQQAQKEHRASVLKSEQEKVAQEKAQKAEADKKAKEDQKNSETQRKQQEANRKREESDNNKRLKQIEVEKQRQTKADQKALTAQEKAQAKADADRLKAEEAQLQARQKEIEKERTDSEKAQKAQIEYNEKQKLHNERLDRVPPVLSEAEIEAKAQELLGHYQNNEAGTFAAKAKVIREASTADYAKPSKEYPAGLIDRNRNTAVNESHQRVIDRYTQLKADAVEKAKAERESAKTGQPEAEPEKVSETDLQGHIEEHLAKNDLTIESARALMKENREYRVGGGEEIAKLQEKLDAYGKGSKDPEARKLREEIKAIKEERSAYKQDLRDKLAGIDENVKAVLDTDVNFENGIGKQNPYDPAAHLKLEDVKDRIPAEKQDLAQKLQDAAENDQRVNIEYAAESTGRSNEHVKVTKGGNVKVEVTQFSPLYFTESATGDIYAFGYNQRGHDVTYALKSGSGSEILKITKTGYGEAFRGTQPNANFGAREYKVTDVLNRGPRSERGEFIKTSEAKKIVQDALNRYKARKADIKEVIESTHNVSDQDLEASLADLSHTERAKLNQELGGGPC